MSRLCSRGRMAIAFLAAYAAGQTLLYSGGSGLNALVVVNQASTNSLQLGNYYCQRRGIPPENVLRINWTGGNSSWTSNDFQVFLVNPLLEAIASRQLSNQIDYVVLSMDIPFQTSSGSTINSTTAGLFYGLKPNFGYDWKSVASSYAGSEKVFRQAAPSSAISWSFLTTMLTADSLTVAKQIIDQGVASDGTFPTQPVVLAKSSDSLRNIRYAAFDNAMLNVALRGNSSVIRTNSDHPSQASNVLGYETGLMSFSVAPKTFVPGAIADSLTSYGGIIFGNSGQTSLMEFLKAGASGSYGTVAEPLLDPAKFPDPQVYFYQARGFSLAEAYYQSLAAPYMGLVVAEPLAAPFQRPATGRWLGSISNAVLSGTAPLSVNFTAADSRHPIQQIDLFADGKYLQTLTNAAPAAGNILKITLNGYPLSYTVPTNATIAALVTNLVAVINTPAITNTTKIIATTHGDRIELQSVSSNGLADSFYVPFNAAPPGSRLFRVTYVSSPPRITPVAREPGGAFRLHLELPGDMPTILEASTNLNDWVALATNSVAGPLDFLDADAARFSSRFYRLQPQVPNAAVRLSLLRNGSGFNVHAEGPQNVPYCLQFSTDLTAWTSLTTNLAGGLLDFAHAPSGTARSGFYRAVRAEIPPARPTMSYVINAQNGAPMMRVQAAPRPYVIEASADGAHWTTLVTNSASARTQVSVSSSQGQAGALSTFLNASRTTFLDSSACGHRSYRLSGPLQIGTWLQITVTKTNGATVSLAATNSSVTANIVDLAQQLISLMNSAPSLAGADGIIVEDYTIDGFGNPAFNLRARSPGLAAAEVRVLFSGSSTIVASPSGTLPLKGNLSDLRPRNHLYVTAGLPGLGATVSLLTTSLPDGFHELSAVAYEGSHIRTQSRATVPIQVQNSNLSADLQLLDLPANAPVSGTYHLRVTANSNKVLRTTLFSTGGPLATLTNQATANFTVSGAYLGVGQHPFYALVETSTGLTYRTTTYWADLQ